MASPSAPSTVSQTPLPKLLSGPVLLPLIVVFGYVAFVITGIDAGRNGGTDAVQPIVLYIYFSLLLVLLQLVISENRTLGRILYIFVASGFAIVYAGERLFNAEGKKPGNFTSSAWTYIIINALLLIVFVVDAINRRRAIANKPGAQPSRVSPISYRAFAADFGGLAILFFIAALLLDSLGYRRVLGLIGLGLGANQRPYVAVDFNQLFGLHLPNGLNHLETLDVGIAVVAMAVSLLLLVIVGALTLSSSSSSTTNEERFGTALRRILLEALDQTLLSLRLVLSPLIWLIPAFSIGFFSQNILEYLQKSARDTHAQIVDLFNPLSPTSLANLPSLGIVLLLGALAVGAVILSVVVVEHDGAVVLNTLHIFRLAGRIAAFTLAFFLYSLALLNLGAILFLSTKAEPFQIGAGGLLALLVGGGLALYAALRDRTRARAPVAKK
ncbi:MAG TPA: hypothetical protein VFN11_21635 [Ktedonobacterales bacterium]|nr:hypothetical protein [Ktedonobacterales bacterium]